ncbi:MAG: PilZ domain-containing protein [Desulfurivibrionaceae bacterium]
MARNIIILDSSASMRRIIRTMIQATVNDAVVSEAQDAEEARGLIEDAHYHLVIFSRESSGKKWLEFARKRLALPEAQRTNFVLFTSMRKQDYIEEIRRYGIEEYFTIPCAPNVLGELITRLCTPFSMRKARRYSVPDAIASLEQGGNSFPAEIVNFSEGGLLCELDASSQFNWCMPAMIGLELNLEDATLKVAGLYSVVRRLMVVESNTDYSPRRIRLACRFINVPEESKKQLLQVFEVIEKQEGLLGNED